MPTPILLLDVIALVGGTVHTMADGAQPQVATVLFEKGLVSAVGADVEVPEGARSIDVTGLHVVPGLVDAVTTFEPEHDVLYLSAGVTAVRDHGSPYGRVLEETDIRMRSRNPGPVLAATGPTLGGASKTGQDTIVLASPEEAKAYLERTHAHLTEARASLDAIAIDASIDPDILGVVGAIASRQSAVVWGPLPRAASWQVAHEKGQRGLIGLDSILPKGVAWTQEAELPDLAPIARDLAQGGWRVVPLLYGTARILREATEADAATMALLSPLLEVAWTADRELFEAQRAAGASEPWQRALERQRSFVRELHAAGVQLVPGSGAPSPWILPGAGLVDELEEWVEAGVPPEDALRLATRDAADALGFGDLRGRIAKGYSADFAVLGSDPRESTAALRAPEIVVVRGRVLERFEIDELVEALRAQQTAVREAVAKSPDLEPPDMPPGELVLAGQVDTYALGQRLSTERFAVVALEDGAMAYGVRAEVPPSASEDGRILHLVQRIRDGEVEEFYLDLETTSPDSESRPQFGARGRRVGGDSLLTIDRRLGKKLLSSVRSDVAFQLVDASTVVSGLVIARHFEEGASHVLSFEGATMEGVVDRWRMRVLPEDGRVLVLTTRGSLAFGFAADGIPQFGLREHGDARLALKNMRAEVRGGSGFGLASERVFRPVEAAAPSGRDEERRGGEDRKGGGVREGGGSDGR